MKISHFLISLMKTRKIEVFDWWADQSLFSLSSVIIIFLFYWLLFIIKSEFFFQSFFFRASIYLCWQHQFFFFFKNVLLHHSIYNGIVDKSTISMYVKNNNDMIKLYLNPDPDINISTYLNNIWVRIFTIIIETDIADVCSWTGNFLGIFVHLGKFFFFLLYIYIRNQTQSLECVFCCIIFLE